MHYLQHLYFQNIHAGVELIQALRFMDMPQALALALEHSAIILHTSNHSAWAYAQAVAALLGRDDSLRFE